MAGARAAARPAAVRLREQGSPTHRCAGSATSSCAANSMPVAKAVATEKKYSAGSNNRRLCRLFYHEKWTIFRVWNARTDRSLRVVNDSTIPVGIFSLSLSLILIRIKPRTDFSKMRSSDGFRASTQAFELLCAIGRSFGTAEVEHRKLQRDAFNFFGAAVSALGVSGSGFRLRIPQ